MIRPLAPALLLLVAWLLSIGHVQTTSAWDEAGRMLSDGFHAYGWDQEDRLRSVDGELRSYEDGGLLASMDDYHRIVDTLEGWGYLQSVHDATGNPTVEYGHANGPLWE